MTTTGKNAADVVIVGAGLTGLTAARELRRSGLDVILLERADRPGGRLESILGAPSAAFDTGAPSFMAQDAAFRKQVTAWHEAGIVAPWYPRLQAITPYQATPSPGGTDRWVGVPTMASLAEHLTRDLDVRCELTVHTIDAAGDGWQLRCEAPGHGGQILTARRLLVTPPPPVTASLLGDRAPAALREVHGVPCWVMTAILDRPLLDSDGAWITEGRLTWVAREASKPGRPETEAWTLLGAPAWSTLQRGASEHDVIAALTDAARQLPGAADFAIHWAHARLWPYSQTAPGLQVGVLTAPNLVIAGDWCFGGGVEAAWRAGMAGAERLLA